MLKSPAQSVRDKPLPPPPAVPPHALGILPLGNLLLAAPGDAAHECRAQGLGLFAAFSDEFLLGFIVEYLDPLTLAQLGRASKAWRAFAVYEEIWKGWTLALWRSRDTASPKATPKTWVAGSWRATYAAAAASTAAAAAAPFQTHAIRIPLYSDLLYQPHLYATTPLEHLVAMLEASPRSVAKIKRLALFQTPMPTPTATATTTTSSSSLLLELGLENTPVIITGRAHNSATAVVGVDELAAMAPTDCTVRAEAVDLTVREYIAYLKAPCASDEAALYLFDKDILHAPELAACLEKVLPSADEERLFGSDLFATLGASRRPDFQWLIAGPKRSGSSLHKDPNATAAWNAVLAGRKLWLFYPPTTTPPGVYPSDDGGLVRTPNSLLDWWLNWFPLTRKQSAGAAAGVPQWGICEAGDVMYVPSGWWHTVINLEDSIAVTKNFVSTVNLAKVLDFLYHHRALVSGYGDADDHKPTVECLGREEKTSRAIAEIKPLLENTNLEKLEELEVRAESLYFDFTAALRAHKGEDLEIMAVLDAFEEKLRNPPKRTRTSLWSQIVGVPASNKLVDLDPSEQPGMLFTLFG